MSADDPRLSRRLTSAVLLSILVIAGTLVLYFFADLPVARALSPEPGRHPSWIPHWIVEAARVYGQAYCVIAAFFLMVNLDPKRKREALRVILAVILTAIAVNLCKAVTGRTRPFALTPVELQAAFPPAWHFLAGFKSSYFASFPSAHSASAFAFSVALAYVYRRGAWIFVALAALCALSRVYDLVHFPSDIFFGAAFGAAIGYGMMHWRWSIRAGELLLPLVPWPRVKEN